MHPKLADALRSVFYSSSDVGDPTDAPARARAFGRLLDQHVLRGSLERLGIRHLRHVEGVEVTVTILRDEPTTHRSWAGDVHRTAGQIRGYDATLDLSKTPLADWTPHSVLHVVSPLPLELTRSVDRSLRPFVRAYLLSDVSSDDLNAAWRDLETLGVDELASSTYDDELSLHDLHGADEIAAAQHFAAKRAAIEREILRRG